MANDDFYENFLRRGKNYNQYNGGLEFYEDTHDANGNYIPSTPNFGAPQNNNGFATPNNYNSGYPQQPAQNNYAQPNNYAPQNNGYGQPGGYGQPVNNGYDRPQNNYNDPAQGAQQGVEYTQGPSANDYTGGQAATDASKQSASAPQDDGPKAQDLPTYEQFIGNKLNQKFALYNPRSLADVERLIAYLRRMEPALVDFDAISDKPDAQRFMDFISGAAFALGYSLITTRRNQFLIMPDTMDVLKSEHDD